MQVALHHLLRMDDHVVAQVVEAELIVRAKGDVGRIGELSLREVHIVRDEADGEAKEAIDAPHPLAVAPCEVIVDRNHVHALAFERIEIDGQRRDERLALARAHLRNLALVQADAADHLHVEMTHAKDAPRRLAHDSKRLGKHIVEALAVCETLLELSRMTCKRIITEAFERLFMTVDDIDDAAHPLDFLIVVISQESLDESEQSVSLLVPAAAFAAQTDDRERLAASLRKY